MEWIELVFSLIGAILGGSVGGAITNWFVQKKSIRDRANFERKLSRYGHVTAMMELYLQPEETVLSIESSQWDVQESSNDENKQKAWSVLCTNRRQLYFVTGNKAVHSAYEAFLKDPSQEKCDKVVLAMHRDLWS